ncbi:MAG: DUF2156 domain-containing protein [Desulfobacteraceae bacterium]|nr:MAG: DUF2156 domain-containing protein [Desulfobacteraceae bacterium]
MLTHRGTYLLPLDSFKPLEFEDKEVFDEFLHQDPPFISELTFSNLYMWRRKHRPVWRIGERCLLIVFRPEGESPFGLFPVGSGDKREALNLLLEELGTATDEAKICRVDEKSLKMLPDPERFRIDQDESNSDYVYLTQELIALSGKKYHRKKNHLNQFLRKNKYEYVQLDEELLEDIREMQEEWCRMRECEEHPSLSEEDSTIREAFSRFGELDYTGCAILIDNKVEAFSLGEPLNEDTVVIHIEKANPAIPGLYAAVNQLFLLNSWAGMKYVNREQDLGIEGLRKAKQSYYPNHMINKYTLIPR